MLKFINSSKEFLQNPSYKNAIVTVKNNLWAELALANNLASKGNNRNAKSVAQKWKNLKDFAKSEWQKANGKIHPTGGWKSHSQWAWLVTSHNELDWKAKFIIETIGVEFHCFSAIANWFDTSSLNGFAENNEIAIIRPTNHDSTSFTNKSSLFLSPESESEFLYDTSSCDIPSPSSSSSSKRKLSIAVTSIENFDTKENKYHQIWSWKSSECYTTNFLWKLGWSKRNDGYWNCLKILNKSIQKFLNIYSLFCCWSDFKNFV